MHENLEKLEAMLPKLVDVDKELLMLRGIVNNIRAAIVAANEDGVIEFFNLEAQKMFKYTSEEVIGKRISALMPERYRLAHEAGLARVRETRESKLSGSILKGHGLRSDGTEFPIEVFLNTYKRNGHLFFTAKIREDGGA